MMNSPQKETIKFEITFCSVDEHDFFIYLFFEIIILILHWSTTEQQLKRMNETKTNRLVKSYRCAFIWTQVLASWCIAAFEIFEQNINFTFCQTCVFLSLVGSLDSVSSHIYSYD